MICIPIILNINKTIVTRKKDYKKIRWYLLHIFMNIFVTITSINGVYLSYKNIYTNLTPIKMAEPYSIEWFFGPTSPLATLIVASGHLYHILFFSITKSDIYHHLVFAGLLTTLNMIGDYGIARNSISFVLSGFPGIIEYTIMLLYKFEYLTKKMMRYYVTIMHCLVRFPLSILIAYSFFYQVFFNSRYIIWIIKRNI